MDVGLWPLDDEYVCAMMQQPILCFFVTVFGPLVSLHVGLGHAYCDH